MNNFQNVTYKSSYEKLRDCCASPVANNRIVMAKLSVIETLFLKCISFFEMNAHPLQENVQIVQEILKSKR